jgi:branched-chain amino acid transport system ATP-binding protein
VISLDQVTMRFGGLVALDKVSLSIPAGRITGLIGPNGAGKTTAFNLLAGMLLPTRGRVLLGDEDITRLSPERRALRGLSRTFQIPHEFSRLTVIENLMVSGDTRSGDNVWNAMFRRSVYADQERAVYDKAVGILELLELSSCRNSLAGSLSGGQKKLLELGRALMRDPKIVLLDEIGAGINRTLLRTLSSTIVKLNRERAVTFCVIEHDLDHITRLCDEVIVMAQGAILARGTVGEIAADERVVDAYFGAGRYEARE